MPQTWVIKPRGRKWNSRFEDKVIKNIFLLIWENWQAYSKKPHEKRISVAKDINFWMMIWKPLFGWRFSQGEKRVLSLHATEQRLFQRENGFVRTFVWISLLVSGTFWSFYGFLFPKMIDHAHSAIWLQSGMEQVSNDLVLRYFSKKMIFGHVLTECYEIFFSK